MASAIACQNTFLGYSTQQSRIAVNAHGEAAMHKAGSISASLVLSIFLAGSALSQQIPGQHPTSAKVTQVLKSFDNPEGAIFSADGKFLFISNAAEIGDKAEGLGWTEGAGYVSKLEVSPEGEVKTVNDKLITGLTGSLGMA